MHRQYYIDENKTTYRSAKRSSSKFSGSAMIEERR